MKHVAEITSGERRYESLINMWDVVNLPLLEDKTSLANGKMIWHPQVYQSCSVYNILGLNIVKAVVF